MTQFVQTFKNIAGVRPSGTTTLALTQTAAGAALTVNPSGTTAITQSSTGSFTLGALTASSPAVTFSGTNGTPSEFNVADIDVAGWSTGASDSSMSLDLGTIELSDGLTQFSGDYNVTFINQNGVKFGTSSGVYIGEERLVVALFDNGKTLPI